MYNEANIETLQAICAVSEQRAKELLEAASGDVSRAVDINFQQSSNISSSNNNNNAAAVVPAAVHSNAAAFPPAARNNNPPEVITIDDDDDDDDNAITEPATEPPPPKKARVDSFPSFASMPEPPPIKQEQDTACQHESARSVSETQEQDTARQIQTPSEPAMEQRKPAAQKKYPPLSLSSLDFPCCACRRICRFASWQCHHCQNPLSDHSFDLSKDQLIALLQNSGRDNMQYRMRHSKIAKLLVGGLLRDDVTDSDSDSDDDDTDMAQAMRPSLGVNPRASVPPYASIKTYPDPSVRKSKHISSTERHNLQDSLHPGLRDNAPNEALALTAGYDSRKVLEPSTRRSARRNPFIERLQWEDRPRIGNASKRAYIFADKPKLFQRTNAVEPQKVSPQMKGLQRIGMEILDWCKGRRSGATQHPAFASEPEVVEIDRYFKAHLSSDFVTTHFSSQLPPGLQIKKTADQKAIAFVNTKKGRCIPHFDRDTSILLLLSGKKTIMLAPPSDKCKTFAEHSSDYYAIDPFEQKGAGWDLFDWKEPINLKPYEALLIPQNWVHAIKSRKDSVAVSFQVENGVPEMSIPTRTLNEEFDDIGAETAPIAAQNIKVETEQASASRRKDVCGMKGCNVGFHGCEMWILSRKEDLFDVPVDFPGHLVCMECHPRMDGPPTPPETHQADYSFATGSATDYQSKAFCKGPPQLSSLGLTKVVKSENVEDANNK